MAPADIVQFFARHFVSIGWIDRTPGERSSANEGLGQPFNVSAFVMQVCGDWFLVTAGHVIEDLKVAHSTGQVLTNFQLNDTWANSPAGAIPIPIDFEYVLARAQSLYDSDLGLDYACIHFGDHYKQLLQANGIVPIDETAWEKGVPENPDFHFMLGVPAQLSNVNLQSSTPCEEVNCVLLPIREVNELPEDLQSKPHRFYGRLDDPLRCTNGAQLTDIDGMSGGPIIAVKRTPEGQMRYWVVAIQSAWRRSDRIVIGNRILVLGEAIRAVLIPTMRRAHEEDG